MIVVNSDLHSSEEMKMLDRSIKPIKYWKTFEWICFLKILICISKYSFWKNQDQILTISLYGNGPAIYEGCKQNFEHFYLKNYTKKFSEILILVLIMVIRRVSFLWLCFNLQNLLIFRTKNHTVLLFQKAVRESNMFIFFLLRAKYAFILFYRSHTL